MDYADSALATFDDMLGTLQHIVGKAGAAGLGDAVLAVKMAEDMYPLETQFRIAINQVILALGRVFGLDVPLHEEAYGSLDEVTKQLAATRAHLTSARDAESASAETPVDYTLPNGMRFVLSSAEYIRDWTMPNFYFHTTMAYALLRREGLALGKADFMPHMMRYHRPAEG